MSEDTVRWGLMPAAASPEGEASCDILAFGPHPDDIEIGAGATLAREAAAGRRIVMCDLTAGEMGTNGDAATRLAEALTAAGVLGAAARVCLGLPDSNLVAAAHGADLAAAAIRLHRPRLVLANWGDDRHPDHRDGYSLVRRALFLAGLARHDPGRAVPQLPPDLAAAAGLPPWQVARAFYYLINSPARPHILVDVSAFYSHKRRALAAFDSQFGHRSASRMTALNDGVYLPGVEGRDASFGRYCGVSFAEGYIGERFPCVGSLLDIRSCR